MWCSENPLASQQLKLVMYKILPMAWKWCSPEHSLHVAGATQFLKLVITTTAIHMNHDTHNNKLQAWSLLNIMANTVSMNSMPHLGVGIQRTEQNELTLLYGCPTSAGAVILSTSCAPGRGENSHTIYVLTQWAKSVTHHLSVLPRLPQGILGSALPCIGYLSPPGIVSGFLFGTGPSQTS